MILKKKDVKKDLYIVRLINMVLKILKLNALKKLMIHRFYLKEKFIGLMNQKAMEIKVIMQLKEEMVLINLIIKKLLMN